MKYPDDFLNKIINRDCLEILKELPDKSVDLILTDPPYGIGGDKGVGGFGSSAHTAKKYDDDWDKSRPTKEYFGEILRVGKQVIIFGGNYFTDLLPVNGHWIVWDKTGGIKFDNPFSHCELAWTNIDKSVVRKYIVIQQGFVASEKDRYHPTQKPVSLFEGIISDYTEVGQTVLDPFLGSGTTTLAARNLQRQYIGIEISPEYCKIAEQRLKQQILNF